MFKGFAVSKEQYTEPKRGYGWLIGVPLAILVKYGVPVFVVGFIWYSVSESRNGLEYEETLMGRVGQADVDKAFSHEGIFLLHAEHCYLDEDVRFDVRRMTGLVILKLSKSRMTSTQYSTLLNLPKVRQVHLNASSVQDDAFRNLHPDTPIEWINLSDTQIGDKAISSLRGCKRLKTLFLSGTNVGDESLEDILSIPNLEAVHTFGTKISEDGKAKLAKHFKEVN